MTLARLSRHAWPQRHFRTMPLAMLLPLRTLRLFPGVLHAMQMLSLAATTHEPYSIVPSTPRYPPGSTAIQPHHLGGPRTSPPAGPFLHRRFAGMLVGTAHISCPANPIFWTRPPRLRRALPSRGSALPEHQSNFRSSIRRSAQDVMPRGIPAAIFRIVPEFDRPPRDSSAAPLRADRSAPTIRTLASLFPDRRSQSDDSAIRYRIFRVRSPSRVVQMLGVYFLRRAPSRPDCDT